MKLSYDELRQLLVDLIQKMMDEDMIGVGWEDNDYGYESPEDIADVFLNEKESELELPLED